MQSSNDIGRCLALLAVLAVASPAVAATKRPKGKHAPAAREGRKKAEESKKPEPEPAPAEEPAPAADPAPPSSAPEAAPTSEHSTDVSPAASTPSTPEKTEAKAPATSSVDTQTDALERREALRIASGRIEVAAFVGAGAGGRFFRYSDAIGRLLAPYTLAVAPIASFELEAYPLASTNLPALRDIGFRGRVSRAFAVDSKTPDGAAIDTSWMRFGGDVRYRFIAPGRHRFELGLLVGADANYFSMSTASKVAALVPSARTVSVRFGLDGELLVSSRFSILVGGSYLMTTTPGEIYDRFRDARVAGVDANLGFSLELAPGVSARLSGDYTRYFASFRPQVGDPAVAGGALDQQWRAGLGVRYAH